MGTAMVTKIARLTPAMSHGRFWIWRLHRNATVSRWCEEQGVLPESLNLGQRNLEDVFLELTGRGLIA